MITWTKNAGRLKVQRLIAESGGQHSYQSQEEEELIQKARNIISTYHNESEQAKKRRRLEREAKKS